MRENHERWLEAAHDALLDGDEQRARRYLTRLRRGAPESAELLYAEAELALLEEQVDEAIERFEGARALDPDWPPPVLALADAWLHQREDPERALELAEEAILRWPDDPDSTPHAQLLRAEALAQLERQDEARESLAEIETDDPELMADVGALYLDLAEDAFYEEGSDDARAAAGWFARIVELEPEDADAWHDLGEALLVQGHAKEATDAWLECRRLDLEAPRPEFGLDTEELERLAERVLRELPLEVRDRLSNVPIFVEDAPSEALVREGLSPRLLGLFTGTPLPEKSNVGDSPHAPDAVQIFVRNLERECEDREQLEEELRITLLHETAHFFGLEDDDLEALGLG